MYAGEVHVTYIGFGTAMPQIKAGVIKPLVTADWWERTLFLLEAISSEVPCYVMRFDRAGGIFPLLLDLCRVPAWSG